MFVSLDGLDGAGKSTQCRRLADWLRSQGRDVVECADPGGTHVGQVLRQLILDHRHPLCLPAETLLFMASRAQLVDEVIRPALAAGKTIVSDRYMLANVVYQGHAGGLDPQLLWTVGRLAIGDLLPDLTIVLDVPLDQSRTRRKEVADRMERRSDDFFAKVREGFLAEARRDPERIAVVDARRSADEVHADIVRHVEGLA
jgi:dTMP kinase